MQQFALSFDTRAARVIAVLLAAVALALALLGWRILDGSARQEGERLLSRALGMPVAARGAVTLRLLPVPTLMVADIHSVGTAALTVGRASIRLSPLEALQGQLVLSNVVLERPTLHLLRNRHGQILLGGHDLSAIAARLPAVEQIRVVDGQVHVDDRRASRQYVLQRIGLRLGLDNLPTPLELRGQWQENRQIVDFGVAGVASREARLIRLEDATMWLRFPLHSGQAQVNIRGDWMAQQGRLEVRRVQVDGQIQAGAERTYLRLHSAQLLWDGRFRSREVRWQLQRSSAAGELSIAGRILNLGRAVANLYASFARQAPNGYVSGDLHAVLGEQHGLSASLDEVAGQLLLGSRNQAPLHLRYTGQGQASPRGLALIWQGRADGAAASGSLALEGFLRPLVAAQARVEQLDLDKLARLLPAVVAPDQCQRIHGHFQVATGKWQGQTLHNRSFHWQPQHCQFAP